MSIFTHLNICYICMEKMKDGDKKYINCGDAFCNKCIINHSKSGSKICPVCKELFDEISDSKPGEEICVICMDTMSKSKGYLDCGHDFCHSCISEWNSTSKKCPICIQTFTVISKIKTKIIQPTPRILDTTNYRSADTTNYRTADTTNYRSADTTNYRSAATATYRSAATATYRSAATATYRSVDTATYRPVATATYRSAATATYRSADTATYRSAATATYRPPARSPSPTLLTEIPLEIGMVPSKRMFGHFKCICGKWWKSGYAYDGVKQDCQNCRRGVLPYQLDPLISNGRPKVKAPHQTSLCGMCKKLGRDCSTVPSCTRHADVDDLVSNFTRYLKF